MPKFCWPNVYWQLGRKALALVLALSAWELCAPGQEGPKPAPQPSLERLQREIEELQQGQQSILKQLEEIKKTLAEKPVRSDALVRPDLTKLVSLNVHGEPFRGDAKARIAMVEYSDFDCSYCAKYMKEVFRQVERDYIRPGKIRYFFRDLPAPGDTNALLKARIARCAGEQDKFWEVHDLLFAEPSMPIEQKLTMQGHGLGLDLDKLNQCVASGRYTENIERSAAGATRLGIRGTPAFVIGALSEDGDFLRSTNVLVGGENYDSIKSVLDILLTAPAPH